MYGWNRKKNTMNKIRYRNCIFQAYKHTIHSLSNSIRNNHYTRNRILALTVNDYTCIYILFFKFLPETQKKFLPTDAECKMNKKGRFTNLAVIPCFEWAIQLHNALRRKPAPAEPKVNKKPKTQTLPFSQALVSQWREGAFTLCVATRVKVLENSCLGWVLEVLMQEIFLFVLWMQIFQVLC